MTPPAGTSNELDVQNKWEENTVSYSAVHENVMIIELWDWQQCYIFILQHAYGDFILFFKEKSEI